MSQPYTDALVYCGARGTCFDVTSPGGRTRYLSDQAGATLPYHYRNDQGNHPNRTQVADVSDFHSVFISYGQSWRSHSLPVDHAGLSSGADEHFAFAPQRAAGSDLLPPIGIPSFSDQIADLRGLNWRNTQNLITDNAAGCIGWAAARAFVRMCHAANYPRFPVVDVGTAYPGYTWPQLQPGTLPWAATQTAAAKVKAVSTVYGKKTRWLGVGWTHGAFTLSDTYDYYAHLQQMVAAFDGLNLNAGETGQALRYYTDMYAGTTDMTEQAPNTLRQLDFAKANASRVHLIGPRYPYPMVDEIHHTGRGYAQYGELEALAKFRTCVYGWGWTPSYVTGVTASGAFVDFEVSGAMPDFGPLELDTVQIEAAQDQGFRVRVAGVFQAVTGVSVVTPNRVRVELVDPIAPGAPVEASYAWYGPGAAVGTHSGVWGNVKRKGPASVLFPGSTTDVWLCNHRAVVTAA